MSWPTAAVYAFDTCQAVFESKRVERYSDAHVAKVHNALVAKMKIRVSSELALLAGHGAGYFPHLNRTMVIDSSEPSLLQFLNTFHESVHVATDQFVRTKPDSVAAALAISFEMKKSDDGKAVKRLHPSLPVGYDEFTLDEVKAYRKQALLLEQIHRENPGSEGFLEEAASSNADSQAFAEVSRSLLEETKTYLQTNDEFRLMRTLKTRAYAEDAPGVTMVLVQVPRVSGGTMIVGIPIKDLTPNQANRIDIKGLRDRVIAKLESALEFVAR